MIVFNSNDCLAVQQMPSLQSLLEPLNGGNVFSLTWNYSFFIVQADL